MRLSLGLLALLCLGSELASASPGDKTYACKSDQLEITYSSSDDAAYIKLTDGSSRVVVGERNQITYTETPLGEILTFPVFQIPDLQIDTLSLLLPEVNFDAHTRRTKVHTALISQTRQTHLGGPGRINGVVAESSGSMMDCVVTQE